MGSKGRENFERWRSQFRSPAQQLQDAIRSYGLRPEREMDFEEAREIYEEAIGWAQGNDLPMQDYWAGHCGRYSLWDEDDPQPAIDKVVDAMREMGVHLNQGRQRGLSLLEQRVVDTLWEWVPHNYQENYVSCAREISQAIVRLLPPESEERTKEGLGKYIGQVIDEVKRLADKHDVYFDTTQYNLALGYFYEWLPNEYGLFHEEEQDDEEPDDEDYQP